MNIYTPACINKTNAATNHSQQHSFIELKNIFFLSCFHILVFYLIILLMEA